MSETFGDRVRRLRIGLGFSQNDLAQIIGTTPQSVWKVENGRTRLPQPHIRAALARALNTSEGYLITGLDQMPGENGVEWPSVEVIMEHVEDLTPEQRRQIAQTIRLFQEDNRRQKQNGGP